MFEGKVIVFIGILFMFLCGDVMKFIEDYGGKMSFFVFKKIYFVFVGVEVGSKLDKVCELGVMVIDEV